MILEKLGAGEKVFILRYIVGNCSSKYAAVAIQSSIQCRAILNKKII